MTWADQLPAVSAGLAFLLLPGLALGYAMGARGLLLYATAPPVTLAVVGIAPIVLQPLGVGWGLRACVLVVLAVSVIVLATTRTPRPRTPAGARSSWPRRSPPPPALLAWSLAALLLGRHVFRILATPGGIAQSHDNMFHLNAVRYIVETGRGSSLTLASLGTSTPGGFYPSAWHDYVSLIVQVTNASVPVAVNAASLALVLVAWPLGCLQLVTLLVPERTRGLLIGAVLSAAFSSFPYLLLDFGIIYPFMTALCLLPATLALLLQSTGTTEASSTERTVARRLLAPAVLALAVSHPSVLMLCALLGTPLVVGRLLRPREAPRQLPPWSRVVGAALVVGGLVVGWVVVRPPRTSNWDDWGDPVRAAVEVLIQAPAASPHTAWFLVGLVGLGVFRCLRQRADRWALWFFGVGAVMHVVTQWRTAPELRWWVSGVWYSDPFRPAAFLAVAALPVAALGAAQALDLLGQTARQLPAGSRRWRVAAGIILTLTAAGLVNTPAVQATVASARVKNAYSDTAPLLTGHELALLGRLDRHVPPGARVAGDPLTGASLSYAIAGRDALEPAPGIDRGPDGRLAMRHLVQLGSDPRICPALARLRVGFVLDFGHRSVDPGPPTARPGLSGLGHAPGFSVVDSDGPARLYRITGCPASDAPAAMTRAVGPSGPRSTPG